MTDRPYKGLVPYSEEDAEFFFGREKDQEIISANLIASRLTLLYGESGVGKSSALRAGVAYHLRQSAQRRMARRGELGFAVVVFSSWRDDPIVGLATRIQDTIAQLLADPKIGPVAPSRSLVQTLQAWTERIASPLLIILDQFEEYFLYHSKAAGEGTFAVEFPRAVNCPDLRVNFLISIREEALATLDCFKGRIPHLFDNNLRIEHLDFQGARDAIEKPIAKYNQGIAREGHRVTIDPALVDEVLKQLASQGEGRRGDFRAMTDQTLTTEARVQTPYLQLVMTRLWDEEIGVKEKGVDNDKGIGTGSRSLRLDTLKRLGGTKQIQDSHLRTVMDALSPIEQDTAARVFQYLVTKAGTKIAYPVFALVGEDGLQEKPLASMVNKLSSGDNRILRSVGPVPGKPAEPHFERYEIYHDVLASGILDWRREYVTEQEIRKAKERAAKRLWILALVSLTIVLVGVYFFQILQANEELERRAERTKKLEAADTLYGDGYKQLLAKDYPGALASFKKALSTYKEIDAQRRRIETLLSVGKVSALSRDFTAAKQAYSQAREFSRTLGDRRAEGQALENLASLKETEGSVRDALEYYSQAEKAYGDGGDPQARGRILDRLAAFQRSKGNFVQAVGIYQAAIENYALAGDLLGRARAEEELKRTRDFYVPWGFLTDLHSNNTFDLKGGEVKIGRDVGGLENEIKYSNRVISRRHLIIRRDRSVEDLRSRNGTTINGRLLPYGVPRKLDDKDIVTLANIKALQFRASRPISVANIPSGTWAIYIDNTSKTYRYLTDPEYSLLLVGGKLVIKEGSSGSPLMKLRWKGKAEMFEAQDEWYASFEVKATDYDYKRGLLPSGNWVEAETLPLAYVKLSQDRKEVREEGPSFQLVLFEEPKPPED